MESVSSEFERIGDLAAAVDGSAYAAMAYRRRGLRGSAQASGTRAEAIAAQCGGVSTPALAQITAAVSLTDREREIAMLIGEGLSSESVARRLKLSVRTVENHIYRAMAKAGADSRHDTGQDDTAQRHVQPLDRVGSTKPSAESRDQPGPLNLSYRRTLRARVGRNGTN